jgi:hypothetical protein
MAADAFEACGGRQWGNVCGPGGLWMSPREAAVLVSVREAVVER